MSKDYVLTDEDGERYSYDNLTTSSWLAGKKIGSAVVALYLSDRAGKLFAAGRDEEARLVRHLSKDVTRDCNAPDEESYQLHNKNHPSKLEKE